MPKVSIDGSVKWRPEQPLRLRFICCEKRDFQFIDALLRRQAIVRKWYKKGGKSPTCGGLENKITFRLTVETHHKNVCQPPAQRPASKKIQQKKRNKKR